MWWIGHVQSRVLRTILFFSAVLCRLLSAHASARMKVMDNQCALLAGVYDMRTLTTTDPRLLHEKLGASVASKLVRLMSLLRLLHCWREPRDGVELLDAGGVDGVQRGHAAVWATCVTGATNGHNACMRLYLRTRTKARVHSCVPGVRGSVRVHLSLCRTDAHAERTAHSASS